MFTFRIHRKIRRNWPRQRGKRLLDAQPAHLYKYTEKYHNLYPSATQILKASVFPAVKLLRDLGINAGDSPESSGLLVHTFSNAHHLAETSQLPPDHPALPVQAFIFDSLPGMIDLRISVLAFTAPIRSPIARTLAKVYFGALYIASTVWRRTIGVLLGQDQEGVAFFGRIHQDLSDPRLFPQHVPRAYMYSEADQLVQPENVERHARKTKESLDGSGMDPDVVRLVKFEDSQRVSHARQDPQRY
ncbi:hypothetical protein FRC10_009479 [Ceratobasidium sp. 414]|nr:hypothetical protein FRC10_009479 [Ceratobasidium sp. 414]